MDIGCQMYHADQPYTNYSCSYRRPEGGGSSSPLRSRCSPLTGEEAGRLHSGGQPVAVDGMSFGGGACTGWVLSGRPNVSDIPRSSLRCSEQRREVIDGHHDAQSRAYLRQPNDSCPDFDAKYQLRVCRAPVQVSRNDLNVGPSSIHAARLLDVDQYAGHRAYDAMITSNPQFYRTNPRPSGTYRQQSDYIERQRQHDHSPPEMLVRGRPDVRQRNNYNCKSLMSGNPRYDAYDYSKIQNGHVNGGSDIMLDSADLRGITTCNGLQGRDSGGVFGRQSPAESSNSTVFASQSTLNGAASPSASRLDVTAAVSPCLEAHELSLSGASFPLGAVSKTPRRSVSSSSSSSSSSTPNIIRRHLKTIAQSLDVRLAALGAPVHLKSRTSRHEPVSTHRKLALTRSTSEPEVVDRDAGAQRVSAGDSEFDFNSSCPSYRVRAVRDQRDYEPPSPTTFVGRSPADSGSAGCVRSPVDDAVTSKCSTTVVKSPQSTTKSGPATGDRWTLSSPMHKDITLPKVRCMFFLSQLFKK